MLGRLRPGRTCTLQYGVRERVILSLLFCLVLTPVGFVMRFFRDSLRRLLDDRSRSQWIEREPAPVDRASYKQQF